MSFVNLPQVQAGSVTQVADVASLPTDVADGAVRYVLDVDALYLRENGIWKAVLTTSVGGDVVGPASATDNAVVRFDGTTGKLIQNSAVTIADTSGNIAGAGTISSAEITSSSLTASRALVSGSSKEIQSSAVTATELGYVSGVSSAIQTQINTKQATGNYITALTGDVTAAGPGSVAGTVAAVGGSTAAAVGAATVLANAATSANTANAIIKRGASGEFSAGVITASLTGDVTGNASGTSLNVTGVVLPSHGGSGIANNDSATTTRSGNHALTLTTTNTTGLTLPTTGTLSTLDGAETFTQKTLTSPKINENVALTTTATKLNYLTSAGGTTGTTSTNVVFSTSPALTTPDIGVATATSVNKVAVTAPATSATLTLANGSTLATSGAFSTTLTATATTAVTLPTSGTLVGSADTGTVTSTMILDGTILNADINASAAIVETKLLFTHTALSTSATSGLLRMRSGTFTTTPTGVANVTSVTVTANSMLWSQVGNIVTCTGEFVMDANLSAPTATEFTLTLPVTPASNFAAVIEANGLGVVVVAGNSTMDSIRVYATVSAKTVTLLYAASTGASGRSGSYNFQYLLN